jgi:SET domain-containing protein
MPIDKQQLFVRPSGLAGAGNGLFTKIFIPKKTRIVEYKGRIINWKEVDADNPYIYYVKRYHVIDARPYKKAFARYANDARGLQKIKAMRNNSKYIEEGLKVFIESVRDIHPDEEILVDYGKEYWDAIRFNIKLALAK